MDEMQTYACPMHPEVQSQNPGRCPRCGMVLEVQKSKIKNKNSGSAGHGDQAGHVMEARVSQMSFWEKFKLSMTMTMGMEHGGLAGREMARLMEEDIRNKFFFSLFLTLPIIAYSPLGENILGLKLPQPIPVNLILLLLTTPVFFYGGWIFLYSTYKALQKRTL